MDFSSGLVFRVPFLCPADASQRRLRLPAEKVLSPRASPGSRGGRRCSPCWRARSGSVTVKVAAIHCGSRLGPGADGWLARTVPDFAGSTSTALIAYRATRPSEGQRRAGNGVATRARTTPRPAHLSSRRAFSCLPSRPRCSPRPFDAAERADTNRSITANQSHGPRRTTPTSSSLCRWRWSARRRSGGQIAGQCGVVVTLVGVVCHQLSGSDSPTHPPSPARAARRDRSRRGHPARSAFILFYNTSTVSRCCAVLQYAKRPMNTWFSKSFVRLEIPCSIQLSYRGILLIISVIQSNIAHIVTALCYIIRLRGPFYARTIRAATSDTGDERATSWPRSSKGKYSYFRLSVNGRNTCVPCGACN